MAALSMLRAAAAAVLAVQAVASAAHGPPEIETKSAITVPSEELMQLSSLLKASSINTQDALVHADSLTLADERTVMPQSTTATTPMSLTVVVSSTLATTTANATSVPSVTSVTVDSQGQPSNGGQSVSRKNTSWYTDLGGYTYINTQGTKTTSTTTTHLPLSTSTPPMKGTAFSLWAPVAIPCAVTVFGIVVVVGWYYVWKRRKSLQEAHGMELQRLGGNRDNGSFDSVRTGSQNALIPGVTYRIMDGPDMDERASTGTVVGKSPVSLKTPSTIQPPVPGNTTLVVDGLPPKSDGRDSGTGSVDSMEKLRKEVCPWEYHYERGNAEVVSVRTRVLG